MDSLILNSLPGWKKDAAGNLIFEITPEEQVYIDKSLKGSVEQFRGYAMKSDLAELIQKESVCFGLTDYANDIFLANEKLNQSKQRNKNLEMALAAHFKAASLSISPVSYFSIAMIYEALNKKKLAKEMYKTFLSKCGESEKSALSNLIDAAERKTNEL